MISEQQILQFALFQLGIVSDLIEGVRLYNLPVPEHSVQQVLRGDKRKLSWLPLDDMQSCEWINIFPLISLK